MKLPNRQSCRTSSHETQRRKLLHETLDGLPPGLFDHAVQWFCDPTAINAFPENSAPLGVVYDGTHAPAINSRRGLDSEAEGWEKCHRTLLQNADLVLIPDWAARELNEVANPRTHVVGQGIDFEHFSSALLHSITEPAEFSNRRPRLGYFGPLDDRLNYDLLTQLANHRSDWEILLAGTMSSTEALLPDHPNIAWKLVRYSELPMIAGTFDVCIMPFLSETCDRDSPMAGGMALEYMACGKPIVTTCDPNSIPQIGPSLKFAQSNKDFIKLCEQQLKVRSVNAILAGINLAADNTLDGVIYQVDTLLEAMLREKCKARSTISPP